MRALAKFFASQQIHFSDSFNHLKTAKVVENNQLLLSVILSDAINLGLSKMAEATTDATYSKLYHQFKGGTLDMKLIKMLKQF